MFLNTVLKFWRSYW